MADSVTANYDFVKPEVGASGNTWGGKTNANWDSIDTLIAALDFLAASSKASPILADRLPIIDTETDPDTVKYITFTQLKALILAAVSLNDTVFELVDNSDGTKKLQFQLSGITAANTRTLTVPDLSGTIALIAGGQTFTQPVILLKQGAAEVPTAEGDIRWDTDDNVLVIGDGAATKIFASLPASTAAGDLMYLSGEKVMARLAKSTKGKALRQNAAETAPEWGSGGAPDAVLEDRKTSGTGGGSFTNGSWQTRTLNTEVRDAYAAITLAANQFTPSVDGWVEWSAPAYEADNHQTRLFNVTDATTAGVGTAETNRNDINVITRSFGGCAVVAGKTYRLEHICTASGASFGSAASSGETEVYARLTFWVT